VQQSDDWAGGLPDDRVNQPEGVFGAGAESDQRDVRSFAGGDRADVFDVDLACDHFVAEGDHDRDDQLEAVFTLVGDQDAEMISSVDRSRHTVNSKKLLGAMDRRVTVTPELHRRCLDSTFGGCVVAASATGRGERFDRFWSRCGFATRVPLFWNNAQLTARRQVRRRQGQIKA
jgi:hypothetical protein